MDYIISRDGLSNYNVFSEFIEAMLDTSNLHDLNIVGLFFENKFLMIDTQSFIAKLKDQ